MNELVSTVHGFDVHKVNTEGGVKFSVDGRLHDTQEAAEAHAFQNRHAPEDQPEPEAESPKKGSKKKSKPDAGDGSGPEDQKQAAD